MAVGSVKLEVLHSGGERDRCCGNERQDVVGAGRPGLGSEDRCVCHESSAQCTACSVTSRPSIVRFPVRTPTARPCLPPLHAQLRARRPPCNAQHDDDGEHVSRRQKTRTTHARRLPHVSVNTTQHARLTAWLALRRLLPGHRGCSLFELHAKLPWSAPQQRA